MFCSLGGQHAISQNSICYNVFFKYIRGLGHHFPPVILSGSDGCTTSHLDDALLASTFGCLLFATAISGGVQFELCLILDLSAFGHFFYFRATSSFGSFFFSPFGSHLGCPILAFRQQLALQHNLLTTICSINILGILGTISSTQPWRERMDVQFYIWMVRMVGVNNNK
jgi:hypothetical protein